MPEKLKKTPNLAADSLIRIHPRYMRSVHLERDFSDPTSSEGYVLTPVAAAAFQRIGAAFKQKSTQRAFRITGDYGAGKSAFGLALARIAAGNTRHLPLPLRSFCTAERLQPLLATGDNEPLSATVIRALGGNPKNEARPSTSDILSLVQKAIEQARSKKFRGIILILDELGKNLEFAAQHREADDIFLLQRLAEEAARSGEGAFVMVVMLHQGVAAYAEGLDSTLRREWDKVSGRFEEIIFAQPLEQVANLVAATLNVDIEKLPASLRTATRKKMKLALELGIYSASTASDLEDLGPRIFPLDPTVLPPLIRAIRKFGQNERSLFSFLSAPESMGLQDHLQRTRENFELYRLPHFFDYLRHNLLPSLTTGNAYVHWGIIDAVLTSAAVQIKEEEWVLKSVALLNLLDSPDLPATVELIMLALEESGNSRALKKAIAELKDRGLIYERGASQGLCLWPHTSVNLDKAFENALAATRPKGDGIDLLCKHLPPDQIVPRGHYFESGTLRFGQVQFVPTTGLQSLLSSQPILNGKGPDLNLRVLLPANESQLREAVKLLRSRKTALTSGLYVTVSSPPTASITALIDLVAWKWVHANTPELAHDRFAREEVKRQIYRADRAFRDRLGGLDHLELPRSAKLTWFHENGETVICSGRELLHFLSNECNRIYAAAPRILNELINRRFPSSAAVAARTKLADAMASAPNKFFLGMNDAKRPPEMALYLSILKNGALHVEINEEWSFQIPDKSHDSCKLRPVLFRITEVLKNHGTDSLVSIPEISEALSLPPFGVREGLQPFILAIYLATHHQHVALYEDGTYLPEVRGDAFLRLMKEPEFFHLQYCELNTVRVDVFTKLLQVLEISPRDTKKIDLIDLVRPLAVFVSQEVPDYCRNTNRLSAVATAVRTCLIGVREPIKLIFTSLPQACGLEPVEGNRIQAPAEFALRLKMAMHEIRNAYPQLIQRLAEAIRAAFGIDSVFPEARKLIADRASQLAVVITEPSLKAFSVRLCDSKLEERAWIESVANLLARKSPERWVDRDETEFTHQLEIMAGRFKRTELAFIGTTHKLNGHACRIALTKSDGTEVGDLINWDGLEENRIKPAEGEFRAIFKKHGRHGLAAAMRVLWKELEIEPKKEKAE